MMQSSERLQPNTEEPALKCARQVAVAFSGAYKKINLYSANHNVYQDALIHFENHLNSFVDQFGKFRVHVAKDRLLYDGQEIYKGAQQPADLVFILHRDGVLWIEFQNEINRWEIDALLKVLHDHCILADDAEDDIVTALWTLRLPSIAYEAADIELGLDDDLKFEDLACRPPGSNNDNRKIDHRNVVDGSSSQNPSADDNDSGNRVGSFQLTLDERKQLEMMIAAEEKLDGSDYVINVLLYIISTHAHSEDINELLNHLNQAMREALFHLRFNYLQAQLLKLKKQTAVIQSAYGPGNHLQDFFAKLSSSSFLNDLLDIQSEIQKMDLESLKDLKRFLCLLNPSAISPLADVMVQSSSDKLQRILLQTIISLGKQDFKSLEMAIFSEDKNLASRLVFVLRYFSDDHSFRALTRLLHDKAAALRRQALKTIIARDGTAIREIFVLIDDPDENVRNLLLKHLGSKRNNQSEKMLLNYLKSKNPKDEDPQKYLDVCRALGKCGSDKSLPLLKLLLFRWPRLGILKSRNNLQRKGALTALKEIGSKRAARMIDRAAKGFLVNFLRPQ